MEWIGWMDGEIGDRNQPICEGVAMEAGPLCGQLGRAISYVGPTRANIAGRSPVDWGWGEFSSTVEAMRWGKRSVHVRDRLWARIARKNEVDWAPRGAGCCERSRAWWLVRMAKCGLKGVLLSKGRDGVKVPHRVYLIPPQPRGHLTAGPKPVPSFER